MKNKRLLLGDQAIALGAIHAGISGVYAYPGTPSTEITEYIQNSPIAKERGLHSSWCTNEKTAMEAALGVSYVGKRALVCMKHVGMNVCADAFVNSAITGVNGGVVVLAADDPSMHSSQNEQDSRFYGKFALIPILEPSSQQEAYDMMSYAYDLSEQMRTPVLMRITTRMAHSRAAVEVQESGKEVTCTGVRRFLLIGYSCPVMPAAGMWKPSLLKKSCVMRLNSLHLIGWQVRKVWLRRESWLVELVTIT